MPQGTHRKRRGPSQNAYRIVSAAMTLGCSLAVGAWAASSGIISVSPWLAVTEAVLIIIALGLLTYLGCRDRPDWPETEMAKAGERTRMQVEEEWRKALVFAQNLTWKMETELKARRK